MSNNFFCREVRRNQAGDEQTDHLTLSRLRLLTDDGQFRRHLGQGERTFHSVVVGQRDPVQAAFGTTKDQLVEGTAAVR